MSLIIGVVGVIIAAQDRAGKALASSRESSEAMTGMIQVIGAIKDSSDQTVRILRTIDEIAFQTNLLALNVDETAQLMADVASESEAASENLSRMGTGLQEASTSLTTMVGT